MIAVDRAKEVANAEDSMPMDGGKRVYWKFISDFSKDDQERFAA